MKKMNRRMNKINRRREWRKKSKKMFLRSNLKLR